MHFSCRSQECDLVCLGLVSFMAYKPLPVFNPLLHVLAVSFLTILFSMSRQFIYICSINRALSGATTPSQRGPWNDGNKAVLCILQRSLFIGESPSYCLVSYPVHSLGKSYPTTEICILLPQSTGPQESEWFSCMSVVPNVIVLINYVVQRR